MSLHCTVHSILFMIKLSIQQIELARRNEDVELFKNETHPQFSLVKARNSYASFLVIHL